MKNNLKIYLIVAALVLAGLNIKNLGGNRTFTIKNNDKYQKEEIVEENKLGGSSNEYSYSELAISYEEITPTATPIPTPEPTPIPITLDTLPITEIYEFPEETISYYYEKYGYSAAINYICEKYNWSNDQFKTLCAIALAEASSDYIDGYWVVNTMYNRTIAKNWVRAHGTDMYDQAIAPGQFVVYETGSYYSLYYNLESQIYDPAFRGIIDFLVTGISKHDYLSFKANDYEGLSVFEYSCPNGNKYHNKLTLENRSDYIEEQTVSR